jgi:predicted TIM-barrel fold metal-dependent hydrolase
MSELGFVPLPDGPDVVVPEGFRFVDTHVHWWDHSVADLEWGVLERGWRHPRLHDVWRLQAPRYCLPEYERETGPVEVVKAVHVQHATSSAVGETAWLQSLHEDTGWPHGVVGRARMADPEGIEEVSGQLKYPVFRGVRDVSAPQEIGSAAWLETFDALAEQGHHCELMVGMEHAEAVERVALSRPESTVVLVHAGLPVVSRDPDYQAFWRAGIERLARCPNIVVKISGLASASPAHVFAAVTADWVEHCVGAFGPSRAMFASNFMVDRLYTSMPRLVAAYRRAVASYGEPEQAAMFGHNAERVYRI